MDFFIALLVEFFFEIDTGASHQLRDHHALGAVNNERSAVGHQREVTHEHSLRLDLTGLVVHELGFDVERSGVGLAALFTLVERVLLFFQIRVRKRQLHRFPVVFDGRNLLEDRLQSALGRDHLRPCGLGFLNPLLPGVVTNKPVKALGLQCQQIRNRDRVVDFGERQSRSDSAVLRIRCGVRTRSSQRNYLPG